MNHTSERASMSRRGMLAGLGAAGATGAAVLAGAADPATASPLHPAPSSSTTHPRTSPVTSTIASPRIPGHQYVVRGEWDFSPEIGSAQRSFGGNGVCAAVSDSQMWTSVELPAGALVYDIEWYVYNISANPVIGQGRLWTPDNGYLGNVVADVTIPPNTSVTANRIVVPAASNGPFPTAARLMLGVPVRTDATVQVNGVRVGFTNAPMGTVLLPAPKRLYDSRAHTPIMAKQTRAAALGAYLPDGASAAIVNVIVISTHGAGTLAVGANGAAASVAAVRWARTGDSALGQTVTAVSPGQNISVRSLAGSGTTHFLLDLVGYLV